LILYETIGGIVKSPETTPFPDRRQESFSGSGTFKKPQNRLQKPKALKTAWQIQAISGNVAQCQAKNQNASLSAHARFLRFS